MQRFSTTEALLYGEDTMGKRWCRDQLPIKIQTPRVKFTGLREQNKDVMTYKHAFSQDWRVRGAI